MIENILIIDCETTGLHVSHGATLIEVCCVLYNVKHQNVLQIYSTLLPCEANPVEKINKISPELTKSNYSLRTLTTIQDMIDHSDALVAHNAQFDRNFVEAHLLSFLKPIRWICTRNDFPWPIEVNRRRLRDVCQGMGVVYEEIHRAYYDCMLLVQCFNKIEDLFHIFNLIHTRLSTKGVEKPVDK